MSFSISSTSPVKFIKQTPSFFVFLGTIILQTPKNDGKFIDVLSPILAQHWNQIKLFFRDTFILVYQGIGHFLLLF